MKGLTNVANAVVRGNSEAIPVFLELPETKVAPFLFSGAVISCMASGILIGPSQV